MSILVIGDSCTDIFTYCSAERLCPDMPVPVLGIKHITTNPGMASNVYRNILKYIPSCILVTNDNYRSITKNRFVHDLTNHMFFRVDSPDKINRINVKDISFDEYEIVIISDYNKGFLHQDDIEYICSKHSCVFIDTKKPLGKWVENAYIIKINNTEFNNSRTYIESSTSINEKIIHTVGAEGCYFNGEHYPVESPCEVKDSSGAGDSFLAALVIKYYETYDINKSINFANKCAAETIKHRGVTTI